MRRIWAFIAALNRKLASKGQFMSKPSERTPKTRMVIPSNDNNLQYNVSRGLMLRSLHKLTQSFSTETMFKTEHSFSIQARSVRVASKHTLTARVMGMLIANT